MFRVMAIRMSKKFVQSLGFFDSLNYKILNVTQKINLHNIGGKIILEKLSKRCEDVWNVTGYFYQHSVLTFKYSCNSIFSGIYKHANY